MHPRPAVAQVLEARPTRGPGPQRLADRVVAPGLVRLHLREPLPRASDPAGKEVARDPEVAVTDSPLSGGISPVEILDADVAVLDDPIAMSPEERPDLLRRRLHHEREGVVLHRPASFSRSRRRCPEAH